MRHKLLFIIFFLAVAVAFNLYLKANSDENIYIIGININDYRDYLLNNNPLDRLFKKKDILYFIVDNKIKNKIIAYGIVPISIRKVEKNPNKNNKKQGFDYNGDYHNYKETNDLLLSLEKRFPDNAKVFSIGKSIEGRDLNIIHISKNLNQKNGKQNIFIVGCHHAREWISVEIPLLFAKYILENQENPNIDKAMNGANIYILPILNPDGLEFSIHNYRYWRKNRRYNGDFSWGVDLNRNYAFMWGLDEEGSSSFSDSEVYRGISPFSEPEARAVRDFLQDNPPDGSLSFHNFSQLILMPWGYKYEKPKDYSEMIEIASNMSDIIKNINGREYGYGGAESLYLVNGDLDDWIYGTFSVPAFTIELPPTSLFTGGFYTSNDEIKLTLKENIPAILYFINYFIDKNDNKIEKIDYRKYEIKNDNKVIKRK